MSDELLWKCTLYEWTMSNEQSNPSSGMSVYWSMKFVWRRVFRWIFEKYLRKIFLIRIGYNWKNISKIRIEYFGQLKSDKRSPNRSIWDPYGIDLIEDYRMNTFLLSRAIKWTYHFQSISKSCQSSIYFLISTDGTLTWSILHRFDLPMKNVIHSVEVSVDLESIKTKYTIGQFRWYQPISPKCQNSSWGLAKIISSNLTQILFFFQLWSMSFS